MIDAGGGTLLRRIAAQAASAPHRPALALYRGERFELWSYGDLQARARRWGERLAQAAGSPCGGRVAFIVLPHGIDLYAAFLGAMQAGLTPAMLPTPQVRQDPAAWSAAQAATIAGSRAAAIVARQADAAGLGPPAGSLPVLSPEPFRPADAAFAAADPGPEAPALLQHSSGTTGLKKGVVLSFGQIDRHLGMIADRLGATRDDVVASWLPLYHDMGLMAAFLLPLSLGAGVVALDPFAWVADPMSWPRAIARHRATLAWAPNFAFAHLVRTRGEHPPVDLSSLRALIDCSEPCRPATLDRFTAAFADCGVGPRATACCYGMAEVVFAATQTPPGRPPRVLQLDAAALEAPERRALPAATGARARALLSCGPPLDGVELRIDAPEGCAGEILVRSVTCMSGYHGRDDDPGALPDGWRRSGDVGLLDGGELFVCGRTKEMLIVHGRNLYAGDVEAVVSAVPGVKPGRAVALGVEDEGAGTQALAVMLETRDAPDLAALEAAVRAAVTGAFAVAPRHVVVAPPGTLAKSTAGKMSRADNLARLQKLLLLPSPMIRDERARPRLPSPSRAEAPGMGVGADGSSGGAQTSPCPTPRRRAPAPSHGPSPLEGEGPAFELVRQALGDCFAFAGPVTPATAPEHVAGWDSLGHTTLLLRLETLSGARLSEAAAEARTAGELAALVAPAGRLAA